jgi:DNA-binding XRE family transcriptional regulator
MTQPATPLPGSTEWSRTYPGHASQVRRIRRDLRELLTGCPAADDAVLCASELAANAARHSASARPGGQLTVRALIIPGRYARIEVTDQGGPWNWAARPDGDHHGHHIIHALADDWGIDGDYRTRTTWALLPWTPGRHRPVRPARKPASPAAQIMNARAATGPRKWTAIIGGHQLARLRDLHGLTRQQLARHAGISPATLARLERHDTAHCHPRTTARLAIALTEHPAAFTRTFAQISTHTSTQPAVLASARARR